MMKVINIPQKHSTEDYKKAIDKQVAYFSKIDGVLSIYQIGGVSTPGVSDIDLIVVFKNDFSFKDNPRNDKQPNSKLFVYTFTLWNIRI